MNGTQKAVQLSDPAIHEMSLVFGNYKGGQWAPRHPEAVVLGTKAGEVKPAALDESRKSKSFLGNLFEKVTKAFNTKAAGGDALQSAVQDAIEWALDGIQYDVLWSLTNQLQWDLYAIFGVDALTNDEKKDAATRVFAGFTAEMAKIMPALLGETDLMSLIDKAAAKAGVVVGKAGKRNSASDQAHIDAIGAAKDKLGKAVAAAQKAHDAIAEHVDALQPADPPTTDNDEDEDETKAVPVGPNGLPVKKADDEKKPYGDVEYADPGLQSDGVHRYPIDTKEHAKSAWSYINKEENAEKYSADDLAKVKAKIKAACEKFGVEIDDSKAGLAEEIDMTKEEIAALVADTAKAAAETAAKAAAEAVKAELQPQIDAAKSAQATAEGAKTEAQLLLEKAEQIANANSRQTLGGAAGDPTADDAKKAHIAKVKAGIKAALGANPIPTVI